MKDKIPKGSQLIFSGCALAIEELLLAEWIKEAHVEQAQVMLSTYRKMITDPELINEFEDSRNIGKGL